MVGYNGHAYDQSPLRGQPDKLVINSLVSTSQTAADVTSDDNFFCVVSSYVMISGVDTNLTGNVKTNAKAPINFRTLAARWMISPQQAQKTITVTTQRGVRECLNPNIARRFWTNDRMLRYKRLPHPVFSDTMFAKTATVGGNKCAQVYTTSFGWCRAFPMEQKGEAHESLLLLFQRDGVPPSMIVDNASEQIQGDFTQKCRETDCHLRQTEPYSPWMQAAKGCI